MALTGTIGGDVKASLDIIWSASALPNATTKTSAAFRCGGSQGAEEIVISFDAITTLANTYRFIIELTQCATEAGSFTTRSVIYDETPGVGTIVHAAGADIRFIIPTDALRWGKIVITSTENLSAKTITAYKAMVAR